MKKVIIAISGGLSKDNSIKFAEYDYTRINNNYAKATAISPNGTIEYIDMLDKTFVMGIQWHP